MIEFQSTSITRGPDPLRTQPPSYCHAPSRHLFSILRCARTRLSTTPPPARCRDTPSFELWVAPSTPYRTMPVRSSPPLGKLALLGASGEVLVILSGERN